MKNYFLISNPVFRFSFFYWLASFAGILLWSRDWEIIRLASTKQEEDLFGLFGFCMFFSMIFMTYLDFRSQNLKSSRRSLLIVIPLLVNLFFIALVVEFSRESWDYQQYESAFRAIIDGQNPYLGNRYLYPPFFADGMALVYRFGLRFFSLLELGKSSWVFVFYIHQSLLLFFLLLSYYLSLKFASQIGLDGLRGVLVVSAVFLFNTPILRTVSYNQVNFYILASILSVLILFNIYPFLAGIFASIGGMIKLYPFALAFPLLLMKKWLALIGLMVGSLFIFAIDTKFFRNLTLWDQFIQFYLSFPVEQESSLFRNSSPMSLIRNTFDFLNMPVEFLTGTSIFMILFILVWFGIRFFQREKNHGLNYLSSTDVNLFHNMGHLLDFSVISLLIAPSAWEHHYVLAIPLMLWVFQLRNKDKPWHVLIGFVLVFGMPVFNVFPLSYLRLAGLVLLLILALPRQARH